MEVDGPPIILATEVDTSPTAVLARKIDQPHPERVSSGMERSFK